jgi:hypothetical protein
VNRGFHPSAETFAIIALSVANICLLVTAAFYRGREPVEGGNPVLRMRLGYVAVSLGLCTQGLYCVMLVIGIYGWVPLDPGYNSINHLEVRLSNVGGLLSVATFLAALLGSGLRRYAGVWVAATNWFLWGLVGLGPALGDAMNALLRSLLGGK